MLEYTRYFLVGWARRSYGRGRRAGGRTDNPDYEVHLHKKFQKIQKIIKLKAACPKMQKAILTSLVL
jgi:hypothetical protein